VDRKSDLRKRIVGGERTIIKLTELGEKLPQGKKREEVGDRVARLMMRLGYLKDAFTSAFPRQCLYTEAACDEKNKGCFPCAKCICYMNAVYREEAKV
jgi:hypothetical protein